MKKRPSTQVIVIAKLIVINMLLAACEAGPGSAPTPILTTTIPPKLTATSSAPAESESTPKSTVSSKFSNNIVFYDGRPVPSVEISPSEFMTDPNSITDVVLKTEVNILIADFPASLGNQVFFTQRGDLVIYNPEEALFILGSVIQGAFGTNTILVTKEYYDLQTGNQDENKNIIEIPNFFDNRFSDQITKINSVLTDMYEAVEQDREIKPGDLDIAGFQPSKLTHVTTIFAKPASQPSLNASVREGLIDRRPLPMALYFHLSFAEDGDNSYFLVNMTKKPFNTSILNNDDKIILLLDEFVDAIVRYQYVGMLQEYMMREFDRLDKNNQPVPEGLTRANQQIASSHIGFTLIDTPFEGLFVGTPIDYESSLELGHSDYNKFVQERAFYVEKVIRVNLSSFSSSP